MTEKLFSLVVCLALIAALTACDSTPGANHSVAGGAEPGSDAMSTSQQDQITPDPSEVVTRDANGVSVTMRVLWTVSGYVLGKGFSRDEQAAKALLFKPLDINDTEIIFDGQACQGVSFQEKTVNAADYLASTWQTTPADLGIDDQEVQVFKTYCSLPGFQEYMRLGDGRLIVPINGVFFFFEPAVAY
jgi:hypothetical protein